MKNYEFILKNLDCANCANKIQAALSQNNELHDVVVNFNTLKLKYKTDSLTKKQVEKLVKDVEPEVELIEMEDYKEENEAGKEVLRLAIGFFVAMIGFYIPMNKTVANICIMAGYFILLYKTIKNAWKLLTKSHVIDEDFLVTISCIGAFLIGKHMEGLMVILLYEIGELLEDKAVNKTRKSIAKLMDIKPEYANIKIENKIKQVKPETVNIGDIIVIKQGEKIPLDGVVIKGKGALDVSSLTGESKPKNVEENQEVLSGSIVIDGILEIMVTKTYKNSTVSKILELVEHATDKKAKTETFVNHAARIYTPIVIVLAIIIATILPFITNVSYLGTDGSIYRALIFLVISCPCAIAISVPLSYFSGIGRASKSGILIKGSNFLDSAKDISQIVFDKTGTLTTGDFEIQSINVQNGEYDESDILNYALLGEQFSNHPIAKSILKNKKIPKENVEEYKEIPGEGISYKLRNKTVFIGASNEKNDEGYTAIDIKINNERIGTIYLEDTLKKDTKEAIESLRKMNIKTSMFTGDNKNVALNIGEKLDLDEVKYEMLPDEKYKEMKKLINPGTKIAFVGDGINDSPVLAISDVGISMGGVGSSSAIEASDIVIMTDEISKIKETILISKYTNRIIKQNLIFAIGIKMLFLILSTVGITQMWQAVFADVGVTLITILNTLRILKMK